MQVTSRQHTFFVDKFCAVRQCKAEARWLFAFCRYKTTVQWRQVTPSRKGASSSAVFFHMFRMRRKFLSGVFFLIDAACQPAAGFGNEISLNIHIHAACWLSWVYSKLKDEFVPYWCRRSGTPVVWSYFLRFRLDKHFVLFCPACKKSPNFRLKRMIWSLLGAAGYFGRIVGVWWWSSRAEKHPLVGEALRWNQYRKLCWKAQ